MSNIEIELKFPLLNSNDVQKYLNKKAKFKFESFQHDIYFNPPHRNFLEHKDNVCEWFRIRVSNQKAEINYKDWLPHDVKIKTHCNEYETEVSSYDQLRNILDKLNFIKLIEVKKTRKIWDYNDVEISIDIVEDLGEFIEVEYKGSLNNVEDIRKYLFQTLFEIKAKTQEIDLKGYPFLLLEKYKLI